MPEPVGEESLEFLERVGPILVQYAARYWVWNNAYCDGLACHKLDWIELRESASAVLEELLGRTPTDRERSYLLSLLALGDSKAATRAFEQPSEILLRGVPSFDYDGENER